MISALQTKFQKHHKVVFIVLLAVIIVAFVFTIGAAPGIGGDEGQVARQDFFGHNLASEREMRAVARDTEIAFRIEHGEQQVDQRQFENYLLERLALIGMADRLGIPGPSDDQWREYISTRPAFQGENGRFDPIRFQDFTDEVEANPQITEGQVARVLEENFRANRVRELIGGPGYILPAEVRMQLQRNQTLWTVDLAVLDLAQLEAPEVEVTEEALQEFYEENTFRYERSPRSVFSMAVFPPENFLDQVPEPTEEELQAHFERNRARFTPPAPEQQNEDGDTAEKEAEAEEVTLADVRDQVEQSLRRERARRLAGRAAEDFAYEMFEENIRPDSPELQELASRRNAEIREAPPASPDNFPAELGFPRQLQQEVFRLSDDRPFSDPLAWRDNYIVLLYRETLPSHVPPLAEVREQVELDYRAEEERRATAARAEEIRNSIRERMKAGEDFTAAAEAEGLEVRTAEEFTRASPPPTVPRELLGRLDELPVGRVSSMIPIGNNGYFVHVRDRQVPEIDPASDEFVRTAENLSMWSTMAGRSYILQEIMGKELGAGQPAQAN